MIVSININEININNERVLNYKGTLDTEKLKELERALKIIENREGHITFFYLYFISDSVCYSYTKDAKWIEDYFIVQDSDFRQEHELKTSIILEQKD